MKEQQFSQSFICRKR